MPPNSCRLGCIRAAAVFQRQIKTAARQGFARVKHKQRAGCRRVAAHDADAANLGHAANRSARQSQSLQNTGGPVHALEAGLVEFTQEIQRRTLRLAQVNGDPGGVIRLILQTAFNRA